MLQSWAWLLFLLTPVALQVASFEDLLATKVKVILQRAEAKDYRDVAALISKGLCLSQGLASARLLFGKSFQPSECLKALLYFRDGDLNTLTAAEKATLIDAVKAVGDLPEAVLRSTSLSGVMAQRPTGGPCTYLL